MSVSPRFESYDSLAQWIDLDDPLNTSQTLTAALRLELAAKRLTHLTLERFFIQAYDHYDDPKTTYVEQAVLPLILEEGKRIKTALAERVRPWILCNKLPAALEEIGSLQEENYRMFFYVMIGFEYLKRRQVDRAKAILALLPKDSIEFFDLSEAIESAESHLFVEEGPLGEDGEKYTLDHFLAQIDFQNFDRSIKRLHRVAQEALGCISQEALDDVADQAKALESDDWRAHYISSAIYRALY